MRLTLGKFVVHPQHGPAEVVERKTRKVKGEDVEYVVLEVEDQRLQIAVPEDSLSEIGVRDLASHTRLRKLMSLLAKTGDKLEKQWSRRLKALRENSRPVTSIMSQKSPVTSTAVSRKKTSPWRNATCTRKLKTCSWQR